MADIAVGVIGAGGMGSRHAMNLHGIVPGARVAGIYDLDQDRAGQIAADCGGAKAFADPIALIRDPSVDAVLVVSPDPTHAEFVHECLRANKPALSEKPLATTAADALSIVEAEQAQGRRTIGVGFMRRFDPQHVAVKRAVESGQIGRAILFKGVHRNPMVPPHLPGPIVVTNSAIHDLDSTRWLLGQDVTEVWVRGVRTHAAFSDETLDMLLFQMTLTGECLATIECSVAVEYGYEVSAEVVGERGTAVTLQPDGALVRAAKASGVAVPQSHLDRFQSAFVPELTHWIETLQTGKPFGGASAWDGYMATLVAESCIESLRTGKPAKVATPEKPGLYK
jgi:myo-inositol 2-dehydrogenase/D-chiro-inositol 1-dehydrogenase